MPDKYHPLPHATLASGTTFHRPPRLMPRGVGLDDPAVLVMTDLTRVAAVSIEQTATMDAANQRMIANGVRLLFVTDESDRIMGLITATDILGEKPLQVAQRRQVKRSDLLVQDIMTSLPQLEVLHLVDVERARVGDIVATLKRVGRQHALVVDLDEEDRSQRVRGIFSSTQIARQLGTELDVPEVAQTFAEVEIALMH